ECGGPSGQLQIKHLFHAVVTDSHATPFPRSGFVLPAIAACQVHMGIEQTTRHVIIAVFANGIIVKKKPPP
ncbi:hypothetical protein, partial [Gluconacetobacter tumulicola]